VEDGLSVRFSSQLFADVPPRNFGPLGFVVMVFGLSLRWAHFGVAAAVALGLADRGAWLHFVCALPLFSL
jgi:hypothetical protein